MVKADGYGHGSVGVARAALAGGATWLAVALVEEGRVLRDAGIEVPILVLSEPPPDAMAEALDAELTPTLYTLDGVASAARAVAARPGAAPWAVHLKIDTGMHRVGAHPADALEVARRIVDTPGSGAGRHVHAPGGGRRAGPPRDRRAARPVRAGARRPRRRRDRSRGCATPPTRPGRWRTRGRTSTWSGSASRSTASRLRRGSATEVELRPAMSLRAEVTMVKHLAAGDGVSYGLRHVFDRPATVAIVPLGYADGVPRRLGLHGRRGADRRRAAPRSGVWSRWTRPSSRSPVGPRCRPGDPVVLLGEQAGGAHHRPGVGGPTRHHPLRGRLRVQRPPATAGASGQRRCPPAPRRRPQGDRSPLSGRSDPARWVARLDG